MNGSIKHRIPLPAKLDDGGYIDINTSFRWAEDTLTDKQRLFVFYYMCPINNSAYGKAPEAVKRAGYTFARVHQGAESILRKDSIQAECRNVGNQLLSSLTKTNIEKELSLFVENKKKRTRVVPTDYYNFEKRINEDGKEYTVAIPKLPEELTEEQRALIIDVEYQGTRGMLHYKLPDKIQAENELIRIYELLGGFVNRATSEYEVETTTDIIRGELKTKLKVVADNRKLAKEAGLAIESDVIED